VKEPPEEGSFFVTEEAAASTSIALRGSSCGSDRKGRSRVTTAFATVDEYIGSFPDDVRTILDEIRRRIHTAVPEAAETISYQIPTFTLGGSAFVYFAGWKHHVAVYPIPPGDAAFEQELAPYRAAKGTLKFPLKRPIPFDLIERVAVLLAAQRGS
jgi:uncharacterized protein YdhG (YjbR/CyaY superfamily)